MGFSSKVLKSVVNMVSLPCTGPQIKRSKQACKQANEASKQERDFQLVSKRGKTKLVS